MNRDAANSWYFCSESPFLAPDTISHIQAYTTPF